MTCVRVFTLFSLVLLISTGFCRPPMDESGNNPRRKRCIEEHDMEMARKKIYERIDGIFDKMRRCKEEGTPMSECRMLDSSSSEGGSRDYYGRDGERERPQVEDLGGQYHENWAQTWQPHRQGANSDPHLGYRTDQPYILRPSAFSDVKSSPPGHNAHMAGPHDSHLSREDEMAHNLGRDGGHHISQRSIIDTAENRDGVKGHELKISTKSLDKNADHQQ